MLDLSTTTGPVAMVTGSDDALVAVVEPEAVDGQVALQGGLLVDREDDLVVLQHGISRWKAYVTIFALLVLLELLLHRDGE